MTPQEVVTRLKEKNLKISSAESCTGGLFAKMITDISGASEVFEYGAVVYSNRMKHEAVGVSEDTLLQYGAVSANTARELAYGACKTASSDIGVGVTGLAGPGGGTKETPVGTVFFAVYRKSDGFYFEKKLSLKGTRDEVRSAAANDMFSAVGDML